MRPARGRSSSIHTRSIVAVRDDSLASIETFNPVTVMGSRSLLSSIVIGPAIAVAAPSDPLSPVKTSSSVRSSCPLICARLLMENVAAPNWRSPTNPACWQAQHT